MYKIVIVDDEELARERLKELLSKHSDNCTIIGEADTAKAAKEIIESLNPDLLFMDIQLPDKSGLKVMQELSYQPKVIFATAYASYAIKAFENLAIDYLVKPIEQERFDTAIEKLTKLQPIKQDIDIDELKSLLLKVTKTPKHESIAVKKGDKIILVDYEEISHFKAEDKYIKIYLADGNSHLTDKTLSQLEENLSSDFLRIHRSCIVNKNYIKSIEKYFKGTLIVFLNDKNGTKLKSSEKYSKSLKRSLGI